MVYRELKEKAEKQGIDYNRLDNLNQKNFEHIIEDKELTTQARTHQLFKLELSQDNII